MLEQRLAVKVRLYLSVDNYIARAGHYLIKQGKCGYKFTTAVNNCDNVKIV